ncbi:MAG: sulfurtransferase TusA family protein [Actinobacteria bacterium]|nr:sulfurtransferase TusA family protein [Actinomycetota bacterium]
MIVDARGRPCPVPVIELAKALPGVDVGEVIEVLSDDPASRYDIPAWCRMRGQEYLGADGETYRVRRIS